jgi:hypothetical protein
LNQIKSLLSNLKSNAGFFVGELSNEKNQMIKKLVRFFSPSPGQPDLKEDRKYLKHLQWSVFLSATIGYGLFYVCRLSISVVKKPLVDGGILTEKELGIVGSALFFSYAAGKFVRGVSCHSRLRGNGKNKKFKINI